jgi:protein TonB
VAFESWTQHSADKVRRNRLLLGFLIGASAVASGIGFVVLTSSQVAAQEEEEAKVVEVQLAKEPEPPPEPEPAPPPPELRHHAANPGPRLPKLETPTTLSNDKVEEKDAKPASAGGDDPYQKGGGDGSTGAQKAVVAPEPPAPPPAPHLNKPRPVSEDDTPPELIGAAANPAYPAEAKAAGIEGVVLVRYVVTETGEVTEVKAVKGPPELFAVCVAAVRAEHYKPAHDAQGNPISVVKYKKFRMRITT